jgi:NAD dependent epimerase/dehydratase
MNVKHVLVTGADGFIGSHLTEMLLDKGYQVKALSYYNSFNYWGWLDEIKHPNLEVITGDVRDPYFCKHITKNIDTIYHLAALIAIPYSYVAPDSYVNTNTKGTLNICQAAKENGVRRVLVTSTSEVYGTAQYVPIDEKHPKQPQSPYSASKISADMMALSFYHSFELPVIIARPFNTYGPRQSARAIIPTIITQIAKGKKEISLGDTSPTRDFNFVKDVCCGLIGLANCDAAIGEEVNISSNCEISMRHVFELISKIMNSDVKLFEDVERFRPKNSEVFRLWGDHTKIKKMTDYIPQYSIEQGLTETIEWFLNPTNLIKYKSDIYNV